MEQQRSNGLDDMGPIKPSLALCVFGVFVLVYFSLWKGVRSAGKVRDHLLTAMSIDGRQLFVLQTFKKVPNSESQTRGQLHLLLLHS